MNPVCRMCLANLQIHMHMDEAAQTASLTDRCGTFFNYIPQLKYGLFYFISVTVPQRGLKIKGELWLSCVGLWLSTDH